MKFFDCNTYIGRPKNAGVFSPVTAKALLAKMDEVGIDRALVWHIAQSEFDPVTGNAMLAEAIAPHKRLIGCWSFLPTSTGELGDLDAWLARAGAARVRALRAWTGVIGFGQRFLLRAEVVGEILEAMIARRVPFLWTKVEQREWNDIYDLLRDFPELTVILCNVGAWGPDRLVRPLIEKYPNVYVELSGYSVDGGIESFVERYGPDRLIFGSAFPEAYHESAMFMLAHSEIDDDAKLAIASGNLERLLEAVEL